MYKVSDNPPPRFPEDRPLDADEGLWWVVRVKSRCEKLLARQCIEKDISYYLPLYEKKVRRKDNNKYRKSLLPLFPGYVALAMEPKKEMEMRLNNHVLVSLPVQNQKIFISELKQIQRVLDKSVDIQIHSDLFAGDKVKLRFGPMAGVEGVIKRLGEKTRLIIQVEMFTQSISVEVDDKDIVKV